MTVIIIVVVIMVVVVIMTAVVITIGVVIMIVVIMIVVMWLLLSSPLLEKKNAVLDVRSLFLSWIQACVATAPKWNHAWLRNVLIYSLFAPASLNDHKLVT